MPIQPSPTLRIGIVSPSDVAAEKACISSIVLELNRRFEKSVTPVQLRVYAFETDVPAGLHRDGPQGLADQYLHLEECDYVIGIFWKKFGTPTLDSRSGTEHELRTAQRAFAKRGAPDVLLYFKTEPFLPESLYELDQYRQVMAFKEEFSKAGRYRQFKDIQDFKDVVSGDLWTSIQANPRLKPSTPLARGEESDALVPPLMTVRTTPLKLRDRGITELLSEIEISISAPSHNSTTTAQSKYDFLIAFNTGFTGQLQPGQQGIVLLRLTYSDGNTLLLPAKMTSPSVVKLNSVVLDFPPGISSQTFKIGNLRANASAIGTGGFVCATVVLLNLKGETLSSSTVECGSIMSCLEVGLNKTPESSADRINSPIVLKREILPNPANISDLIILSELTFYLSFVEGFPGVFRSREGESDTVYQWVTHGTRLRAGFVVPPGVHLFVTVYNLRDTTDTATASTGAARLVSAGGSESRRFWNNPLFADNSKIAIQRLPINETSGSAEAVWEWSGNLNVEKIRQRATFGILVAADNNPSIGHLTINGDLGPLSAVINAASDPIPRFVPASGSILAAVMGPS